ncbi:phage tail tip fiber protein [Rhodoligotrophos ferricapiens]|uniref:phage tail tip fiber protein n=1 Tax=Rhodoligotrophos ferricapiens TaxID=3069264 RepID=UPI00315D27A5
MPAIAGAAIAAAIVGASSGAAFTIASAAITAAIGIGMSVGLSALSNALLGPKKQTPGGGQYDLQVGSDVPRTIPIGLVSSKGHIVYWNVWNDNNDRAQLVFALADWECEGLEYVYVNGEKFELNLNSEGDGKAEYVVDGYDGRIVLRWYSGRMDQAANGELVARANPPGRWTANDRLAGICYVHAELRHAPEVFPGGIPELVFVFKGAKLYDIRKDSTAGGTGSHRWNDVSTWEWSDNPAVAEYCYRRGFWRGSELVLGMGVGPYDLLTDYYIAAANVCDETVSEGNGTAKRYACSAILTADVEHRTAITAFTQAMAGYSYEKAGTFGPIAGAAQVPVADIVEDDLALGYVTKWRAKRSRSELLNAVFGTYTDPENQWGSTAYEPIRDETWQAQDGGERLASEFDIDSVISPYQARRIAEIRLRETRMQATGEITVGQRFMFLEPGDWIRFTNRQGGERTYRIARRRENEDRTITLQIGETSPWVYGIGAQPNPTPGTVLPNGPNPLTTVQNVQLQADTVIGAEGQTRPALHVTWTPPDDPGVDSVIIEYRIQGQPATMTHRDDTPEDGEAWITQDVLAGTDYEVRVTITTTPPRVTTWTPWIAIQTTNQYVVLEAVQAQQAIGDLRDFLDELQSQIGQDQTGDYSTGLRRELLEDMEATVLAIVGDYQSDLTVSKERRKAELGLLQEVSLVYVRVGKTEASILQEALARADGDSALATLLSVVEAKADQATASGRMYWEASAAPSGVTARYSAIVEVDDNETKEAAGLFMEVVPDGQGGYTSRVAVQSDTFFVYDTADGVPKVVFVVGTVNGVQSVGINGNLIVDGTINTAKLNATTLSAITANLGTVTAGKMQSPDGKFLIDLTNKLIRIEV